MLSKNFVQSEQILNVISMSTVYSIRPSQLLGNGMDEYTAYCFDEVCAYISSRIKSGEEPDFTVAKNSSVEKPHYNSLSDMYSSLGYSKGSYKK